MRKRMIFRKKLIFIVFLGVSLVCSSGCQSLRKKFTRKAKAEQENLEEVIYEPQEYPAQVMSNEQMYRLYFNFWKSWDQELVEVLAEGQNRKKQVECINEMVNNLKKMKDLLTADMQIGLDNYLQKLAPVREEIVSGKSNATNFSYMKGKLESLRSKINKEYAPRKIINYLIP